MTVRFFLKLAIYDDLNVQNSESLGFMADMIMHGPFVDVEMHFGVTVRVNMVAIHSPGL